MKRQRITWVRIAYLIVAVLVGWRVAQGLAAAPALDTAKIERLTGAKGELNNAGGVFTVRVPRTDLAVTAAGVKLTPPMGLTAWAAFRKAGSPSGQ